LRFRQRLQRSGAHAPQPAAYVYLIGRPAASPVEQWLAQELAGGEGHPQSLVIDRLAQRMLRQELAEGAWAIDAGIWGPALYQRDAARILRFVEGDFIQTFTRPLPDTTGPAATSRFSRCGPLAAVGRMLDRSGRLKFARVDTAGHRRTPRTDGQS
jgi:hypothetical protein